MAHYLGQHLIVSANGTALAASKSCSIDVTAAAIPVSSPDDGEWEHNIAGRMAWKVTTSHLIPSSSSGTAVSDFLRKPGAIATLSFTIVGNSGDTLSGSALCTVARITASVGNLLQGSWEWTGSGPLAPPSNNNS